MKKILLSVLLLASIGLANRSQAQCSGASVTISNFTVIPASNLVLYTFTWQYVQGNASLEVVFLCNGVEVGSLPCMPRLKDSAAGPHVVAGSFNTNCAGTFRVEIRIWSNPDCGGTYCTVFRDVANSPLPVSFASFSASRNSSNVNLTWSTASEQNNSGFAVERNTNGNWTEVGFVPTQATGGFSDALLRYAFTDLNNVKGITQYRIRQVDISGKSKYSEIRAVRSEGQPVKLTIYPNPTVDGKVSVVFDESNVTRNVSVLDMSGRVVKQITGITNNNITIENLKPGMYTLRVTVPETGEQGVQKIIVNER
jgi:hypothetical protein